MSFLDFLLQRNIINNDLHQIIREKAGNRDAHVYDLLVSMGDVSEDELAKLKANYLNLEFANLADFSKIEGIDYAALEKYLVLPFRISPGYIHISIHDPNDIEAKDKMNYCLSLGSGHEHLEVKYYIASKSNIQDKFDEINSSKANQITRIILNAIKRCASDIHITPFEKTFVVMFRIDGILEHVKTVSIDEFEKLVISLKVSAKLDISESRRPQSGHFHLHNVDFRMSTHPTAHGENIVIRVLNKDRSLISLENLGFNDDQIIYLQEISSLKYGMIIFCGPTGSGKTTSIYSLLEIMDKTSRNIMTLEDPVEYKIQNVRQTEIKHGIMDFADGVRSILRQDPDVILIGEIRDKETAKMAMRASMTGHLVLTTIHANDSFGAIARLKEFEISSALIADNVTTIISQRLARKRGISGRTVVAEILKVDAMLGNMICLEHSKHDLKKYAIDHLGYKTISEQYSEKIRTGNICDDYEKATYYDLGYETELQQQIG
ncbi:MAG: type II/IV secretion system protein [Holosporales bacterium]|jgi:type II secretory ATPase GspE/PulE/Tfp pilus assembly ATPase PilB-like protein|nr:type II/IV secretion system protein [Holosporales bacterium]